MKGSRCSPGEGELIHFRETEVCARVIWSSSCKENKQTWDVCSLFTPVSAGISDILDCKSLKFEGPLPVGVQRSVTASRTTFLKIDIFLIFHVFCIFLASRDAASRIFPQTNTPSSWLKQCSHQSWREGRRSCSYPLLPWDSEGLRDPIVIPMSSSNLREASKNSPGLSLPSLKGWQTSGDKSAVTPKLMFPWE